MGISANRVHAAFIGIFIFGGLLAYFVGRDQVIGMALGAAGLAYMIREFLVPIRNRLAFLLVVIILVAGGVLVSFAAFHSPAAAAYFLGLLAGWFIRDLVIGDEPPASAPAKRIFGLWDLERLESMIRPLTKEKMSDVIATLQYLGYEVTVRKEIEEVVLTNCGHIRRAQEAIKALEWEIQGNAECIDADCARNAVLEGFRALQPDFSPPPKN